MSTEQVLRAHGFSAQNGPWSQGANKPKQAREAVGISVPYYVALQCGECRNRSKTRASHAAGEQKGRGREKVESLSEDWPQLESGRMSERF